MRCAAIMCRDNYYRAIFQNKIRSRKLSFPKFGRRAGYIDVTEERRHSSLRPSGKELPKRRSFVFCHKLPRLQSVLSRFLGIVTTIDSLYWWGNSFLFQINLISLWISECLNQFCWNLISTWRLATFQISNNIINLRDARLWHKWLYSLYFSLPNTPALCTFSNWQKFFFY
jgi:hypothetical protein